MGQQFKEAFGIMDADKDGLLSSSDLVAAFGAYGKNIGGGEAQAMLDEVDGPMKFTASEVDDAFAEMKIDEGMIDAAHLKGLMVSKKNATDPHKSHQASLNIPNGWEHTSNVD